MGKKKVEVRPGFCPKCGKELRYNLSVEMDGGSMYYPWTCDCGAEGREYYTVTFDTQFVWDKKAGEYKDME